jgi:hypothetical protein
LSTTRSCDRENNMKNLGNHLALAAMACLCVACTTSGTGGGELVSPSGQQRPVTFTWTSNDGGITGTMTAQLPDGTYQGRFFQITQETRLETLGPLWERWPYGWSDWPYGIGMAPYPDSFMTHYSGKVVATLQSGDKYMRCRFQLIQPSRGMAGGGEGECQLSQGGTIRANFAPR